MLHKNIFILGTYLHQLACGEYISGTLHMTTWQFQ